MISITFNDNASGFLVQVKETVENRKELNEVLGLRLAEDMQDYFLDRNREPNKRNFPKQNWWARVADATQVSSITEEKATVTVAHREGFAMRVRGGEIKPREASALTIPNTREAYGKSVREFEQSKGVKLFRPAGAKYLAYTEGDSIVLAYFLVRQVTIKADPKALPTKESMVEGISEEVEEYLERKLT